MERFKITRYVMWQISGIWDESPLQSGGVFTLSTRGNYAKHELATAIAGLDLSTSIWYSGKESRMEGPR